MNSENKTKAQLVQELTELRKKLSDISALEQTDSALRENEQKYRILVETTSDGVAVQDTSGLLTYANESLCTMLGYSRDEIIGKPWKNMFDEEGLRILEEQMARRKAGDSSSYEIPWKTKDGRTIHTLIAASPIQGSDGNPQGSFVVITDITEGKQFQKRAEHLKQMLRAIRNVNQLIVGEKDRGVLIQRACEILIETRGYQYAWIALTDDSQVATSTAGAGLGENFASLKECMDVGDLPRCCRQALDLGEVVITNDPQSFCEDCPLSSTYHGATSAVTVRLEFGGEILGAIGLAVPMKHAKDPEEISLVEELAGDIGFALHSLQAEEERRRSVQESEELLAVTLKSIGDAVISTDRNGSVAFMNQTAETVTGWAFAEVEGRPLREVFDIRNEETGKRVEDPVIRVFREGVVVGLANHTKLIRRDGSELPIADSGAPIRDEAGEIIGAVLVFQDITERKQAEEALKTANQQLSASEKQLLATNQQLTDSEQRLEKHLTSLQQAESIARLGYFERNWKTGRGYWSKGFFKLLGLSAETEVLEHEGFMDYIHNEDVDRVAKHIWGTLQEHKPMNIEFRLVQKGGQLLHIHGIGENYYDENGKPIVTRGVFQDITERKQAELALRLKNQVFEDSIAALSIADADGIITEVNPAFLMLWGYCSKEDAIGGTVSSFFVNEVDAGSALEALSRSGRWEGDFLARRADGTAFISRGLATAMKNDRGEFIGYQSANLDVTEQRRAEEEIKLRNRIANIFLSVSDDEMYAEVLKVVLDVVESEFGVFGYIDENSALVVPSITRSIWDDYKVPEKDIVYPKDKWGDSTWTRAIRQKKLLFSNSPSNLELMGNLPIIRNISAPIVHQGEVVGLLQAANKAADYTPNDIRSIETLCDIVAPILGARLERDAQDRKRRRREEEMVALNRELDERIAARTAALRDSEKRLRFIMSAGPGVLYTCEAFGDFATTFISENVAEQMGFEAEQFLQEPDLWANRIHPDDRARVFSELEGVFETGSYDHEYRFQHADGSYIWMHDSLRLVKDEQDRPLELIGLCMDITEAKSASDRIWKLSMEQQLIFDSVPSSIWYKDTENRFLRVNRAGAESVGMAVEDIEGKSAYDLFPNEAEKYFQDDLQVIRSGKPKLGIIERMQPATGDPLWVRTDRVPTMDSSGNCTGLVVFFTDITEQRRSQEKVERMNVELTASNKELEAFAYSVSHDLRAPLRGIDGFSKAILDDYQDKLDDTGRDYVNRVRAGAQRMGKLIDDLLKLSRLIRSEIHHQRLDLSELGREIAAELQRDEPDRRVDFDISSGLTARGDRALLEAALENLLRNAWKFTGHREHARIELGMTEQAGEQVYYVRDDGAGFDMAYVDKLFGAFQRLHDSSEFPGSGIGLAIVHRVILRHGGRVWAEGEVDKGATFYFTLPAKSGYVDEGIPRIPRIPSTGNNTVTDIGK